MAPQVLCGIPFLESASLLTAADVKRQFCASLDPALDGGSAVEVYRLERLCPNEELDDDDLVVCRIQDWGFDFSALEELHQKVEDMRQDNEVLQAQHSRTKEALVALDAAVETSRLAAADAERRSPSRQQAYADRTPRAHTSTNAEHEHEVQQLKQQLAESEKKQQETKATVIALRSEFMQLVDMMSDSTKGVNLPTAFVGAAVPSQFTRYADLQNPAIEKAERHVQASARIGGYRHPATSPRNTGGYSGAGPRAGTSGAGSWTAGNRPGATRPRAVQQRGQGYPGGRQPYRSQSVEGGA